MLGRLGAQESPGALCATERGGGQGWAAGGGGPWLLRVPLARLTNERCHLFPLCSFTEGCDPPQQGLELPANELVLPGSAEYGLSVKQMSLLGLTGTGRGLPEINAVSACCCPWF